MFTSRVALLLFGLAVASALPTETQRISINWPENPPSWWPERFPWPPALPENPPSFWPEDRPWPPTLPEDAPSWWPGSFPWPPQRPESWPENAPSWWPENFPWPPAVPENAPSWWPDSLPWPPQRPEDWPENAPSWWPNSLPWPPALPSEWPDRPTWWPESLPWPPALPSEWPDQPSWWPDSLPWPPAIPDELPEITWPPTGIDTDRIPYIPSRDNEFHLFTRENRFISQPLVIDNDGILSNSNYRASRKTVVLVHDREGSATSASNAILIPALLNAADVNVIVVDWSKGAWNRISLTTFYSVLSGNFVSRFLNWLAAVSNADLGDFHLVGVGLGGLNVGLIGARLGRQVGQITALDPAGGPDILRILPPLTLGVGRKVEVIHTDGEQNGYLKPLGHVDIYPNGGTYQPGCGGDSACNRLRAVYFFAESVQTGGFTAIQCDSWTDALEGNCHGPGTTNLGGLEANPDTRGVFYLRTNAVPPFSQG